MHVLHGSWLTNFSDDRGAFALWAETNETRTNARGHQHPFVISARDLRTMLKDSSPQIGDLLRRDVKESAVTLLLPSSRNAPQPSLEILRDESATSGTLRVTLAAWQADALTIAPQDTLDLLASLPSD